MAPIGEGGQTRFFHEARSLECVGPSCYRPKNTGQRKGKSIHRCIVDASLGVLNLVIEGKGDKEVPGLIDTTMFQRVGLKRAAESESFSIFLKKLMTLVNVSSECK